LEIVNARFFSTFSQKCECTRFSDLINFISLTFSELSIKGVETMAIADIPLFLTAKKINGDKVINMAGEHLGKIEDLMIDLENGRVAYAVLSFGGFLGLGNKFFAVPWEALSVRPHEHSFVLNVSKEILEKAEGFDKDDWPVTCEQLATSTREWLADIYTCYGCKPYW
jgi:hypothetical protein